MVNSEGVKERNSLRFNVPTIMVKRKVRIKKKKPPKKENSLQRYMVKSFIPVILIKDVYF